MLCAHGNKSGPDMVVTTGYSAFWGPQRTEVSTTAGEEGHIIAGYTPPESTCSARQDILLSHR